MTCNAYDIVVVPFPFTDRSTSKRRPALVLSDAETFNNRVGQSVLARISNAAWFWGFEAWCLSLSCPRIPPTTATF